MQSSNVGRRSSPLARSTEALPGGGGSSEVAGGEDGGVSLDILLLFVSIGFIGNGSSGGLVGVELEESGWVGEERRDSLLAGRSRPRRSQP